MLSNDTDPDGGPTSITAKTNGANGTVAITGGGSGLTYQPNANYCNSPPGTTLDTFTYTLNGGSSATVTMTVTCLEDDPAAVADSATVSEDAGATAIDVLANDTDPDGGAKTIAAKTDGSNGTVVITGAGSGLTYQPAANFCGSDSFTYTLNGGSSATVTVTVTCVNDTPSFTKGPNQTNVVNQNVDGSAKAYTFDPWATGISAGPANESGQTVDFVIDSVNPANLFTVQPAVSPSGVLTFTTNPATNGTATIVLHIHDSGGTANGGSDASATQSFTIQTVHPPPVAVNDSYTATGNVGINVNDAAEGVLQRGTDDSLFGATITHCGPANTTATAVSGGTCTITSASGGNVVLSTNGTFSYDPPVGFTGADHFFYRLTNSGGTSVGDVSITVSNMIWFVKNDALACTTLAAGCGRLSKPFSTLAAFQAVNSGAAPNPQNGNTIFIYTGLGAYAEGVTLRDGQLLIGQGAGASITTISGITLAPFSNTLPSTGGTRPFLTTSTAATNAITLGSGNTVRGLNIGNKTGSGLAGSNFGTLTLSEVDITGTGRALSLNTGTANATFGTLSSSGGTNGVALTGVAGSPSATGGTLTGASGDEVTISGGGGSFTYPGAITNTGANRAVNVNGKSGGTIALSGAVTDTGGTGDGITLTSNSGATINLTGGVQLSTGATPAFTATGGGTVIVTGSANTLTTSTGTALNVANTTIGSSGLTFRSISANGAASGIVLNATGSSGGLTVTGTGTAGSGGTIQNSTDSGIKGTNVTGLSLSGLNVTNNGNGVTDDDEGIKLANLFGTASITNTSVTGSAHHNLFLDNTSGTLASLTITGSTFNSAVGGSGILFRAVLTATVTAVSISGSTFSDNQVTGLFVVAGDTATIADLTVSTSTFADLNPADGLSQEIGIDFSKSGMSNLTGKILNNTTITGHNSHAMNLATGAEVGTGGIYRVRVEGNTIGTAAVAGSGSKIGNGIRVNMNGQSVNTILLNNNTIREAPVGRGIEIQGRNGTGQTDVTVTNNNVNHVNLTFDIPNGSNFPLGAIVILSNTAGTAGYTVRSDVRGNTVPAAGGTLPAASEVTGTYLTLQELPPAGGSIHQLVDNPTGPGGQTATQQLQTSNTGDAGANAGVSLIPGPINTPP